jgi:hypothetical protein
MIDLSEGPFHRKVQLRDDLLMEVIIREVRGGSHYPQGIRYRCYLGNPKTDEVIVLYDIHPGKPHHRHIRDQQQPLPVLHSRTALERLRSGRRGGIARGVMT